MSKEDLINMIQEAYKPENKGTGLSEKTTLEMRGILESIIDKFIEDLDPWISVKDSLPEDEMVVVLVDAAEERKDRYYDKRVDLAFYKSRNESWGPYVLHNWAGGTVTHWKRLPEPKESE